MLPNLEPLSTFHRDRIEHTKKTVIRLVVYAFIIFLIIGTLLWPYTINTWLIYYDKDPTMLWWHGTLFSLVPGIGQLAFLAAAITWVLMLFLQ